MHVIGKHLCFVSRKQLTFHCTIRQVPMLWIRRMCCLTNVQDVDSAIKEKIADRDGDRARHTGE